MARKYFGTDGIRGRVGEGHINPEFVLKLGWAAGRVLSRDTLIDRLKGENIDPFDRSIDVHISRIRAEIEDDPKNPRRVLTVRGAGYVFARQQD